MLVYAAISALLLSVATGFAPPVVPPSAVSSSSLGMATEERRDVFLKRIFCACGAGMAVSTSAPALASPMEAFLGESSLLVSDSIKVLDMGLPTYDDISSSKASVENTKSLYVDPAKEKPGFVAKRKSTPAASTPPKESAEKKEKKSGSVPSYDF